jgi:hypothetical protein
MNNFPTGAEALLIALSTPYKPGITGIPVMLWGNPGVGKSSFLEALSKPDFPVLTLIASLHDPTDFSGLPVVRSDKVHYAVPEWVESFGPKQEGILFLDELTTAPPTVQAALLRVVLERRVGFHELPKGVRIVAAANPPDLMVGGWDLSPPLRNRFAHLEWKLPARVYRNALLEGFDTAELPDISAEEHAVQLQKYRLLIHGFLGINPNLLESKPDSEARAFASPRSWDYAAALMASCGVLGLDPFAAAESQSKSTAFLDLLAGAVGQGIATNFAGFLKNTKVPDPAKVLDGAIPLSLKALNESETFILFNGFTPHLAPDAAAAGTGFARRAQVFMDAADQAVKLKRHDLVFPALRNLAKKHQLIPRLMQNAAGDASKTERVRKFVATVFSDAGFREYVGVMG